jgi:hypothetical protein
MPLLLLWGGVGYVIYAMKYPFGNIREPGVGFFPIIMAFTFVVFSALSLKREFTEASAVKPLPNKKKTLAFSLILLGFVLIFEKIGFWVSIGVSLSLLFRIAGIRKWSASIAISIAVTLAADLLFEYLLGGYFPRGLLR